MFSVGVLLLCLLSWALSAPVDIIVIQIQQQRLVGGRGEANQVLFNGVPMSSMSKEAQSIIENISADGLLSNISEAAFTKNLTVLRSRECILEGSKLHSSDRVLYNGKVYLTLEQTDTWTAKEPQALDLKDLWDQQVVQTRKGMHHLLEECLALMKELKLSQTQEQSAAGIPVPHVLIPVLAVLILVGLAIISLLLSKATGSQVSGGVLGSIVHYPVDMAGIPTDKQHSGYQPV